MGILNIFPTYILFSIEGWGFPTIPPAVFLSESSHCRLKEESQRGVWWWTLTLKTRDIKIDS